MTIRKRARGASPAMSENEMDIGLSLFGGAEDEQDKSSVLQNQDLNVLNGFGMGSASEAEDDAAAIARHQSMLNRKASSLKGRTVKKGGGFQAMGLNQVLLKAITRKGFSVPTPIQRKTIPLLLNQKDVVGMARTGSGKTAAFVIPMIEKLKTHSTQIGSRALILSPSRELALQTLQVTRELGKGTDLKSILLVGGDSLEDQFAAMSTNPDIIIAAPGRFVHLMVEMSLDLSSIQYVVFDEADRLFEMGFAAQLSEILHALPSSRQTLLFSATLPKTLVEFARAGLQDPILVRLDAESKISPDLQSAFFTIKSSEKDGALLHILQDIIQVPISSQLDTQSSDPQQANKKRKRDPDQAQPAKPSTSPHATIIFAATKHRVEYLHTLLTLRGYSASHVYGTLDQTARKQQVSSFRSGFTNILVVTDVAARGIDIPVLANVINYDFPAQPKIFVHRVGRTARAGQRGWSFNLVNDADAPYLLDLQLFLGKKLCVGRARKEDVNMSEDVVVGALRREGLQTCSEWVVRMLETEVDLYSLHGVAANGDKRYFQTRGGASTESVKRAKALVGGPEWGEINPMFVEEKDDLEAEREKMLARIGGFRPEESIFEIGARRGGKKQNEEAVDSIRKIRSGLNSKKQKSLMKTQNMAEDETDTTTNPNNRHSSLQEDPNDDLLDEGHSEAESEDEVMIQSPSALDSASDTDLEITFSNHKPTNNSHSASAASSKRKKSTNYRDSENYLSYTPTSHNAAEDTAYTVNPSSNFATAADSATLDLNPDESSKTFGSSRQVMRWDKRHKKYVRRSNDEDGSKGQRLVRGESGAKIAASFRSGRFDAWKKANRVGRVGRVGEAERTMVGDANVKLGGGGRVGRHKKVVQGKAPDKFRDDFEKKRKKLRERAANGEADSSVGGTTGLGRQKNQGKVLNSVDDIRKQRRQKEKRREKNARPSRRDGKR